MRKMPQKKEVGAQQVVADLEKAGIPLRKDLELTRTQQDLFKTADTKERSKIVEALVSTYSANIKKIEEARKNDPEIRENEKNPEYKRAMDQLLKGLKDGLNDLVTAQFDYGKVVRKTEFQKERTA